MHPVQSPASRLFARSKLSRHREAFSLMQYSSDDGATSETIWNSRDGVTPFIVGAKDMSILMKHVDWSRDITMMEYKPPVGSRIFINLTLARARGNRQKQIDLFWDDPMYRMSDAYPSKEMAVETLAREDYADGHTPDLVAVTPEMLQPCGHLIDPENTGKCFACLIEGLTNPDLFPIQNLGADRVDFDYIPKKNTKPFLESLSLREQQRRWRR